MVKQKRSTEPKPVIKANILSKVSTWMIISLLLFSIILFTGIFSPESFIPNSGDSSNNVTNADLNKTIPVILYSSPTCGCCHKYVDYLNDNGFDTFQKRTDSYKDIKDQNGIPDDLRSCHTAIVSNYFLEGHIPVSALINMLTNEPDFDGIALPGMPSGSPGMGGDKKGSWEISSIKDGQNIGIFEII